MARVTALAMQFTERAGLATGGPRAAEEAHIGLRARATPSAQALRSRSLYPRMTCTPLRRLRWRDRLADVVSITYTRSFVVARRLAASRHLPASQSILGGTSR